MSAEYIWSDRGHLSIHFCVIHMAPLLLCKLVLLVVVCLLVFSIAGDMSFTTWSFYSLEE